MMDQLAVIELISVVSNQCPSMPLIQKAQIVGMALKTLYLPLQMSQKVQKRISREFCLLNKALKNYYMISPTSFIFPQPFVPDLFF